jgi:hypothetical protein
MMIKSHNAIVANKAMDCPLAFECVACATIFKLLLYAFDDYGVINLKTRLVKAIIPHPSTN